MGTGRSTLNLPVSGFSSKNTFSKQETLTFDAKGRRIMKPTNNDANDKSWDLINVKSKGRPVNEFFEEYELTTQVLGTGSYAEVRLAKTIPANDLVAVKILRKEKMDNTDIADVRREVALLQALEHDNIVKIYDYYEDNDFMYLTMEYISAGELFNNVDKLVDYTEKDTRDIMYTLIEALLYCKRRGIAHRDIKPENILLRSKIAAENKPKKAILTKDQSGLLSVPKDIQETSFKAAKRKYEVVIADFGFAAQVSRNEMGGNLQTQCGSPLFIAPEIIMERKYNYKCDIWSLGVVCFNLLSGGSFPFMSTSIEGLYKNIVHGKFEFEPESSWTKVSGVGKEFVKLMLVVDPKKRASYEELLSHPWFQESSINTPVPENSVNFAAMKKFNAKRKMLKAIKAKQAAAIFKKLMDDLSEERGEDETFQMYKKVALADFYKSTKKTSDVPLESQGTIEEDVLTESQKEEKAPPGLAAIKASNGGVIDSAYFHDVDDLV